MIQKEDKIYFVSNDTLSKNISDKLRQQGFKNILTTNYDIYNKDKTTEFFNKFKPTVVIMDPSKEVDGKIQNRIGFSAFLNGAKKIVKFNNFFHQKEYNHLVTNIHYDTFYHNKFEEDDLIHEILRSMHESKVGGNMFVELPDGLQKLNILHIEDLTDAVIYILKMNKIGKTVNINNCCEMNFRNVAYTIKEITGYEGNMRFHDCIDEIDRQNMVDINDYGWKSKYEFDPTIRKIYRNLLDNHKYFMVSSLY